MRPATASLVRLAFALAATTSLSTAREARADNGSATPVGVRLELRVDTPVVHEGDTPGLSLRFLNAGGPPTRVVVPLDGSWEHMRQPRYTVEYLDAAGAVVPDVLGGSGGRCGNTNPFHPTREIVPLPPGASLDPLANRNAFPYDDRVQPSARPGRYQVRVRYESTLPGATPLSLVSNTATLTVDGGSEPLWRCYRGVIDGQRNASNVSVSARRVVAWESGFAALYVRQTNTVANGEEHASDEVFVQRLDDHLRALGAPVAVAAREPDVRADMVVLGDRLLVVVDGEERRSGAREPSLLAAVLHGAGGALAVERSTPLADQRPPAEGLGLAALVARGDAAWLLFYAHAGRADVDSLSLQRFRLDGTADGAPRRLARTPWLSSTARLVPSASGLLALWSNGESGMRLLRLDANGAPQGRALALDPALRGEPAGLRETPRGFTVAYNRNEGPTYGLYSQEIDATGASVGAPVVLSRDTEDQPDWGVVQWNGGVGIRANEFVRPASTPQGAPTATLQFAALGGAPTVLSTAYEGDGVAVTNVPGGFVMSWTDTRDDRSTVCARAWECAGEAYAALLDARGAVRIAPTRVTSLAMAPAVPTHTPWERFCSTPQQ